MEIIRNQKIVISAVTETMGERNFAQHARMHYKGLITSSEEDDPSWMTEEEVVIGGKTRKKKLAKARTRSMGEIEKLRQKPINESELDKLKNRSIVVNLEKNPDPNGVSIDGQKSKKPKR